MRCRPGKGFPRGKGYRPLKPSLAYRRLNSYNRFFICYFFEKHVKYNLEKTMYEQEETVTPVLPGDILPGKTTMRIKLLLADDQRLFADNLKLMLETLTEDIKVAGIASDGEEAIRLAESTGPDLVLMDVRMPGMDGVEATKILHQKYPEIKIVMLTTFLDDTYVEDALKYGAYGYILKSIRSEDLIASLRAIFRGAVLFSPDILKKLVLRLDSNHDRNEQDNEYQEIILNNYISFLDKDSIDNFINSKQCDREIIENTKNC
jgi:DNA-binding NarL/FixJ family response regulator